MADRKIKIKVDYADQIYSLFEYFAVQLADGYWENSAGMYGSYKDEYYPDIWNCFDFKLVSYDKKYFDHFVVVLKSKPVWPAAKEDLKKLQAKSDIEIADYLKDALINAIEDYPDAFEGEYSEEDLAKYIEAMKEWKVEAVLPKLSHKDLVKLIGYDFEYKE